MENIAIDDINLQTKRKFDSTDIDEDGSIVKRSKASGQQTQIVSLQEKNVESQHNLLHFSDDVMLYILQFCSPRELKALSFCCRRLARLCMDRSLWKVVELREQALGTHALSFYTHCLKPTTTSLYIRGLIGTSSAKDLKMKFIPPDCKCISTECYFRRGSSNKNSENSNNARSSQGGNCSSCDNNRNQQTSNLEPSDLPGPSFSSNIELGNTSPKPFSPYDDSSNNENSEKTKKESRRGRPYRNLADCCKNRPICIASITKDIMIDIRNKCTVLRDLRLEYCSLNCNSFPLSEFPKTLKILSLKGCRRFNIPIQNPFLFKIQDYLPELEELDLSYCRWLSGHSLLLLSKMSRLKKLWLRGCIGLGECVAYASLSTRFGFKALEVLDVRETSVGDSEVSSFSFLNNLKELYLEPPSSDINVDPPIEWPEHSGLMETWESEFPCNEVDEYIDVMNKDEMITNENYKSNKADIKSPVDTKDKDSSSSSRASDDDTANIGVFYRSVVNVSYEERNLQGVGDNQNANQGHLHNENPPVAPARQVPNPEGAVENGMGVQVGPVGVQVGPLGVHVGPVDVQVGHAGVQVGPVRLQMRPPARPDGPQPENAGRPGIGGVQVGPVEVQVGPDGVQVGLGGVRVEPGWVNAGPDGEELGGVRVDPGWMQIAPGVHVGFEGVEVGPVEVQVAPDGERREAAPVGLQVGPIEVQVGPVRFEIDRDGRRIGPNDRNNGRGQNPENAANRPQQMHANNEERRAGPGDRPDAPVNADNRNQNVPPPINIPGIWINENDPERRLQIGFNVHLRAAGQANPRVNQNNDRLQAEAAQGQQNRNDNGDANANPNANNNAPNPVNEAGNQGDHRMEDEEGQNPDNERLRNIHEIIGGRCRYLRGLLNGLRIPYNRLRVGNDREFVPENVQINPRDFDRFFLHRALRRALIFEEQLRHRRENREGEQQRQNEQPEAEGQREFIPNEEADQNEPARQERNDRNEQPGQAGENAQIPNDEQARPEQQPGAERRVRVERHNIMDGRVHVIYVNPQYPRRPAAEVLVAAGMPRNAGVMMLEGENFWRAREEFVLHDFQHLFDFQRVLDLQLNLRNPGVDLQHLGGTDLVTDASLLHFGDSEQLVHVGGPHPVNRRRYSPLEVLICRGYRGVTDQSLSHLTTAAPALRHLDVVGCNITRSGAEEFTSHRPDCKLHYNADESAERQPTNRRQ